MFPVFRAVISFHLNFIFVFDNYDFIWFIISVLLKFQQCNNDISRESDLKSCLIYITTINSDELVQNQDWSSLSKF